MVHRGSATSEDASSARIALRAEVSSACPEEYAFQAVQREASSLEDMFSL